MGKKETENDMGRQQKRRVAERQSNRRRGKIKLIDRHA